MSRILFKFIIYPSCERTLKNGRLKSKIVRKSSFGDMIFFYFTWLYMITFHLFSVLCQRRNCCWNIESHLKNRYHYAKEVENARINFSISPYCTLLFSRKENFKFLEVALSAVLCNGWLHYECVRISALKYCQYHTGHLLAFRKWP